ncbi:hypothetical protein JX265_013929 [Neoarthrinium moseri]|uniref:Uncharacterized protein n=1 Tax=Neoarthrinium moseri TaxID=1658444 RepID=A0A9Q0AI29_9PEZI|nr:uncharacterized protein JN550_002913 [Neoarthrinium moseri]KAI1847686.1 hypothetical protein JX265_013929 [Neoarthrinium moseri]KAI1874334.1 hypothetical protein JN550_002913 [Neoarthrinium moseri]
MRNAEEDLKRWSMSIKGETNFLPSETTEDEATENTSFRNWATLFDNPDSANERSRRGSVDILLPVFLAPRHLGSKCESVTRPDTLS